MITTLITAGILATALTGSPQAPADHSCRKAGDGWARLLSVNSPDGNRRWLSEGIRTALAACEANRAVFGPPSAIRMDPGFSDSGFLNPRPLDSESSDSESSDSESSDSGPADSESSDRKSSGAETELTADARQFPRTERPTRIHQPAVALATPAVTSVPPAPSTKKKAPRSATSPAKRPHRPSRGQIAAAAALRQIGRPYVWGGGSSRGPTRGGFDCSGLALHAWSKAGTTLTHYTGSQFKQGRRVPFSQLRPGDLVFFGGGAGDPTHVGVHVKDGVMVHAPKTGDVVKTTNFADSAYYRLHYRGAVRPTPR